MTFLERINVCPPYLCRLRATKGRGRTAMSHRDIAKKAGISKSNVINLSRRKTWDRVRAETIQKFSEACGVDLLRPGKMKKFFRNRKLLYIKTAKKQEKKMLVGLMAKI